MGDFHLSGAVVPSVTEVLLYVLCVCVRTPLHASVRWPMSHRLFGAKARSRLMGLSLLSAQRMCSLTGWLIKAPTQLFSHSQKKKKKKGSMHVWTDSCSKKIKSLSIPWEISLS